MLLSLSNHWLEEISFKASNHFKFSVKVCILKGRQHLKNSVQPVTQQPQRTFTYFRRFMDVVERLTGEAHCVFSKRRSWKKILPCFSHSHVNNVLRVLPCHSIQLIIGSELRTWKSTINREINYGCNQCTRITICQPYGLQVQSKQN